MSGSTIGSATFGLVVGLQRFRDDLATAGREADTSTRGMSDRMADSMESTGRSMTRSITPAAAAVAATSAMIERDWSSGMNAIISGTGAAGDELDGLLGSMKTVAGQVPQDMGTVGAAIADVNTRLGLTGTELESTTKKFLDLSRVTGGDVQSQIASVSRVFGDWGIATEDQEKVMDQLLRTSQLTGASVDGLSDKVVQFGAPMRQLGFDFETSIALLGQFEKEGVNTELVMGSMRQALGRMARSGEDAQETFTRVTEEIKNAGSTSEANLLAMELFGARAGPDMAAAIREGRFELGDLVSQISEADGTIADAADRTLRLSDRLSMFKNRVTGVVGPFAEFGMVLGGAAAGMGPMLIGTSKVVRALPGIGRAVMTPITGLANLTRAAASTAVSIGRAAATMVASAARATARVVAAIALQVAQWAVLGVQSMLHAAKVAAAWLISMGPIGLIVAAVVGLVAVVVKNWDTITGVISGAVDKVTGFIKGFISWLSTNWPTILAVITGPFGLAVLAIVKNWDTIKAGVTAAKDWVVTKFGELVSFVTGLPGRFTDAVRGVFDGIRNAATTAKDWVRDRLSDIVTNMAAIPGRMATAAAGLFDGVKNAFRSALNWIIEKWNNFSLGPWKLPQQSLGPFGTIGGQTIHWQNPVQIPLLAAGGNITAGGLGIVGEVGPELLELPTGARVSPLERLSSSHGSTAMERRPQVVQLMLDGRVLAEYVIDYDSDRGVRNGRRRRAA